MLITGVNRSGTRQPEIRIPYRVESLGRLKILSEEDYETCRGIRMPVDRTYEGLIG
jgi:hypothetical protein